MFPVRRSSPTYSNNAIRKTLASGLPFLEAAYIFGCPLQVSGLDCILDPTGTIAGLPRIGVCVNRDRLESFIVSEDIDNVTCFMTQTKHVIELIPPPHYYISGVNMRVQGSVDLHTFDVLFDHPENRDTLVFRFGETYLPLKTLVSTELHIRKRVYWYREWGVFETTRHRVHSVHAIKSMVVLYGPCLVSVVLAT